MRLIVFLAVLGLVSCKPSPKQETQKKDTEQEVFKKATYKEPVEVFDRYWDDYSRYLAGMPPKPGSVLDSIEFRPEAANHRSIFEAAWQKTHKEFVVKLDAWAKETLKAEHENQERVFYPFSGADFMTIHTLYPQAKEYVMFGLEPEGDIRRVTDISKDRLTANLNNLCVSMNDILSLSYFMTNDMRVDMRRCEINGTLPVLLAFMARTENIVLDVQAIHIAPEGKTAYSPVKYPQIAEDSLVTGVEIRFRKNETAPIQSLKYFSVNVSDMYLNNKDAFLRFFQNYKPSYTYIKSASYLMHSEHFSKIRNLVLETSKFLLQEDSGIPLRSFDTNTWNLKFYGAYNRPIPLFANRFQQDLYQAFRADPTIKPLDFGIGYNHQVGTSNLMAAWRKDVNVAKVN